MLRFFLFFLSKKLPRADCLLYSIGQLVVCIALDFFAYTLRDSGQLVLSFIYFGLGQDILLISSYILAIYFCFLLLYIQVNQYTVSSLQIWSRPFFPVAQVLFLKLLNLIFQSTQNFYESCTFKFAFSWKILTQNFLIQDFLVSKGNRCGEIVLFDLVIQILFVQHLHNNLKECQPISCRKIG